MLAGNESSVREQLLPVKYIKCIWKMCGERAIVQHPGVEGEVCRQLPFKRWFGKTVPVERGLVYSNVVIVIYILIFSLFILRHHIARISPGRFRLAKGRKDPEPNRFVDRTRASGTWKSEITRLRDSHDRSLYH
jgi:hypothetical protein